MSRYVYLCKFNRVRRVSEIVALLFVVVAAAVVIAYSVNAI